jgi:uncharacterized RDD family membrane protein YckC
VALSALVNLASPNLVQAFFGSHASSQATSFLLVALPVMLYFALLESSVWQATWGKHKCDLRVIGADGARLSLPRALGHTALKFIPWELSHTLIWSIRFAPDQSSTILTAGFTLVWLLVGANVVSEVLRTTHQTLYDQLAGTYVVVTKDG